METFKEGDVVRRVGGRRLMTVKRVSARDGLVTTIWFEKRGEGWRGPIEGDFQAFRLKKVAA